MKNALVWGRPKETTDKLHSRTMDVLEVSMIDAHFFAFLLSQMSQMHVCVPFLPIRSKHYIVYVIGQLRTPSLVGQLRTRAHLVAQPRIPATLVGQLRTPAPF